MRRRSDRDRRYLVLSIGTLVIVGGGLIALIYGLAALLTSLPFLLFGSVLILLLWWLMPAIAGWRERSEKEYHDNAARHIMLREGQQAAKEKDTSDTDNPGR